MSHKFIPNIIFLYWTTLNVFMRHGSCFLTEVKELKRSDYCHNIFHETFYTDQETSIMVTELDNCPVQVTR